MSIILRMILILLSLAFNALVIYMVRVGRAELRYALAWLLMGVVLLVLSCFPNILNWVANAMNVVVPINAAFFFAILFMMSFLIGLTVVISGQKTQIFRLTQLLAIQQKQVDALERRLKALEGEPDDRV